MSKRRSYARYIKRKRKAIRILKISALTLICLLISILLIYMLNDAGGFLKSSSQNAAKSDNVTASLNSAATIEIVSIPGLISEADSLEALDEASDSDIPTEIVDTLCTPTSISISWNNTCPDGYIVKYRQKNQTENHGKDKTEQAGTDMSLICTCVFENNEDGELSPQNGWVALTTDEAEIVLTGLTPEKLYEVYIFNNDTDKTLYTEALELNTYASGYCDPFANVDGFLTISERDESTGIVLNKGETVNVKLTAAKGCLGAIGKTVLDNEIHPKVNSTDNSTTLIACSDVTVTEDEDGNYCYRSAMGEWYLHVLASSGQEGWINARTVMLDIAPVFKPENPIYGIQINRTNATSSLFTAGGSAYSVDMESPAETRYDCISANEASVVYTDTGYNVIDGITGQALPNYSSDSVMPVIWDLALEMIQCQKNALENGYTIVMYEGYRPLSTSMAVYGNLLNSNSLSLLVYGTNLAQGFLTDRSYDVTYYISQYSLHNMGIATDLSLIAFSSYDSLGEEVKMPTKMHTLDFRCNMQNNNWQADLLADIMTGHGSNLMHLKFRSEWWHFQLNRSYTDLYPLASEYGYMDFVF